MSAPAVTHDPTGLWWIEGVAYGTDPTRGAVPTTRYAKLLIVETTGGELIWREHLYWEATGAGAKTGTTASGGGSRAVPPLELAADRHLASTFRTAGNAGGASGEGNVGISTDAGSASSAPTVRWPAKLSLSIGDANSTTFYPVAERATAQAIYQFSGAAARVRLVDNGTAQGAHALLDAQRAGFLQFRGHGYRLDGLQLDADLRALLRHTAGFDIDGRSDR